MRAIERIRAHLRPGRPIRFVVRPEDLAELGALTVKCATCDHLGFNNRPDVQLGHCTLHRLQVGTTTPVLCPDFEASS